MYINKMYYAFVDILEMSILASISIIVLLLLRSVLERFPRIIAYLLWGIILFRLLCPVSFESPISILKLTNAPFMKVLFSPVGREQEDTIEEAFEYVILDEAVVLSEEKMTQIAENGEKVKETYSYPSVEGMNVPMHRWLLPVIWIIGMGAMMGYGVGSYISLKRRLVGAVKENERIYSCDYIKTAFVLGFVLPRIYIPSNMEEAQKEFVILHEQVHMVRRDSFFAMFISPHAGG